MDSTIFNFAVHCGFQMPASDMTEAELKRRICEKFACTSEEAEVMLDECLKDEVLEFFVERYGLEK